MATPNVRLDSLFIHIQITLQYTINIMDIGHYGHGITLYEIVSSHTYTFVQKMIDDLLVYGDRR